MFSIKNFIKRSVYNRLLLLLLLEKTEEICGQTRLMKIVFAIQVEARKKNISTFNYHFIYWHFGAFSQEVITDLEFMENQRNLLVGKNHTYILTNKGRELLVRAENFLQQSDVEEIIGEIACRLNQMSLKELLNSHYNNYILRSGCNKGNTLIEVETQNIIFKNREDII